jgi:hypothetical protein
MAAKLRVASEVDAPKKPKTLAEAVESGTYLEILEAQQREIASTVGEERGPAKAALHRQLALISKEIEQLRMAGTDDDYSVVAQTDDEAWDGTGY